MPRAAAGAAAAAARRLLRRGVLCGVGATCGFAVVSAQQAECKPKDVPDYLMPFYLTTLRRRFNHYATAENARGQKRMTSEDFVRALLCAKRRNQEVKPAVIRKLDELFRVVDANADGLLSFAEFSMFMLFLTNSRDSFRLAFEMFDTNESGTVDVEEFKQICTGLSIDPTIKFNYRGGITSKFFGSEHEKQLSFKDFWSFVDALRVEVWRAEFKQFDHNDSGTIRPDQFAALVTNQMLGSHLPFYIVDNIRRLKYNPRLPAEIEFEAWESLNMLMLDSKPIGRLIQLYTARGAPLPRAQFEKACKLALPSLEGRDLTTTVELIYSIFDRDGNGSLESDEFLSVARSKFTFNSNQKNLEETPPFFKLLEHCVAESWDKKWISFS